MYSYIYTLFFVSFIQVMPLLNCELLMHTQIGTRTQPDRQARTDRYTLNHAHIRSTMIANISHLKGEIRSCASPSILKPTLQSSLILLPPSLFLSLSLSLSFSTSLFLSLTLHPPFTPSLSLSLSLTLPLCLSRSRSLALSFSQSLCLALSFSLALAL